MSGLQNKQASATSSLPAPVSRLPATLGATNARLARRGLPSLGRVRSPNRGRPEPAAYLHACRSSPGSRKSTDTPGHRDRERRRSTARRECTPSPGGETEPCTPRAPRGPKVASLAPAGRPLSTPRGKHCVSPRMFSCPPAHRAHCARGFLHLCQPRSSEIGSVGKAGSPRADRGGGGARLAH